MQQAILAAMLAILLSLSGCAWILGLPKVESEDVPQIVKEIAKSDASLCAWVGGRGGGGGTPVLPSMAGGYGSGEILIGRVNADNTRVTIKNGECSIERGLKAGVP